MNTSTAAPMLLNTPPPPPDIAAPAAGACAIAQHLSAIFESDDWICVTYIHATKKTEFGASVTENFFDTVSQIISPAGIAKIQRRNADGWNVYVAMNPLVHGSDRRTKASAAPTPRTVFMEVDEHGDEVLAMVRAAAASGEVPQPSIILQSSPGKYQFIWRIDGTDFTLETIEALNNALVQRFGADPASTDRLRVLRIPSLRNLKYPEQPAVEMVGVHGGPRYVLADFKLTIGEVKQPIDKPEAADAQLSGIANYFEQAATEANLRFSQIKKWGTSGYVWEITCPWVHEHTGQKDSGTVVILHNSGALDFHCQHAHCNGRNWPKDFRPYLEDIVGHFLRFGDPVNESVFASPAPVSVVSLPSEAFQPELPFIYTSGIIGDMNDAVLDSRLGDICFRRLLRGDLFPIAYAWPALVTVAGVMVPRTIPKPGSISASEEMTNFFTALVGPVHSGKSQAIAWATAAIGLSEQMKSEVRAGSSEALLAKLNAVSKRGKLGKSLLIDLDEWKHLFDKAGIEHSTFTSFLQTAFYKRRQDVAMGGGREVEFECALSLIGGIVEDEFEECFGARSMGGLHDRFAFGLCPEGYNFIYRPFEGSPEITKPVAVSIDPDVWEMLASLRKANPKIGREAEIALRFAHVSASFDGRTTLAAKDCQKSIEAFISEQLHIRDVLKPNEGLTNDAICANALLEWLRRNAGPNEIVPERKVQHGLRRTLARLGPGALKYSAINLVNQGLIRYSDIPGAKPYAGRIPKGYQLLRTEQ